MKIGNLILLWLGAILVWGLCCLLGWGVAFAFTNNVLVPWLGVPTEWARTAAFITAFMFDGVGAILVLLAFVLSGFGLYKVFSRKSRA